MIILYAKEDYGKFKKGDIIAFHSSVYGSGNKIIEPSKTVFTEQTFHLHNIPKPKTDILILPDHKQCMQGYWNFRVNASTKKLEKKIIPQLRLTTDATDTISPYDGYPDIPADGKSKATIFVQKILPGGSPCNSMKDTEELYIKTDRGKLSTLKLKLVQGKAQFQIQSVPETILATITVFDPNNEIEQGQIVIQFA